MTKGEQIKSTVKEKLAELREAGKEHLSEEQMKSFDKSAESIFSENMDGVLSGLENAVKIMKDAGK